MSLSIQLKCMSYCSSCKGELHLFHGGGPLVNTGPESGLPVKLHFLQHNICIAVQSYPSHGVMVKFDGKVFKNCSYNKICLTALQSLTSHCVRVIFICFIGKAKFGTVFRKQSLKCPYSSIVSQQSFCKDGFHFIYGG